MSLVLVQHCNGYHYITLASMPLRGVWKRAGRVCCGSAALKREAVPTRLFSFEQFYKMQEPGLPHLIILLWRCLWESMLNSEKGITKAKADTLKSGFKQGEPWYSCPQIFFSHFSASSDRTCALWRKTVVPVPRSVSVLLFCVDLPVFTYYFSVAYFKVYSKSSSSSLFAFCHSQEQL